MTTTHATLSPSKAYRYLACPGSVREEARYPEPPSGPGAIDGTHSHTLLEHCIKGNGDPLKMIGVKLKDHEGEFTIDAERAGRVRLALDYVGKQRGAFGTMYAERRVSPAHLLGRTDLDGTCDVTIHTHDELEIVDYKDGMNEVSATDNPQLELYALGVMAGLKLPINGAWPFERVRMTIIQPKLALRGGTPISSSVVTVQEMVGKIGKFVAGAAATDAPDAPLVSGAHCKYCKHKSCATRAGDVMKEVGVMFPTVSETAVTESFDSAWQHFKDAGYRYGADALEQVQLGWKIAHGYRPNRMVVTPVNPVTELSQQAADLDPNTMSADKIAQIMLAAPLLRQTLEAVEEEALRRLKAGGKIPGLKVVHGRGSRSWALPEDEMATKLIGMGIPKGEVYETKLLSVAKVEKLKWEATKGGEKVQRQLSERQLKTLDTEYVAKVAGKLTVVPESDPRQAVVLDASPLFAAVPETPAIPAWLS